MRTNDTTTVSEQLHRAEQLRDESDALAGTPSMAPLAIAMRRRAAELDLLTWLRELTSSPAGYEVRSVA